MIDSTALTLYEPPQQVSEIVALRRRNAIKQTVAAALLMLLLGALYLVGNGNIIVPIAPVIIVALIVLLWNFPALFVPGTLMCACLFETNLTSFADSATDRVPIFWDVNTIFQIYGHSNFHGFPLSLYEVLMIVIVLSALLRGIYHKTLNLHAGEFIWPVLAFISCVTVGLLNGAATGGDMKVAMFEVRAQFYIFFAYIFATNIKQDVETSVRAGMWIAAICIGFKGILLTARYFFTLGGATNPDMGVGSHEESFFFDEFTLLLAVLFLARIEPKLRTTMLCLLPFVMMSNLANERRAATAAMIFVIPMLLIGCFFVFPERRKAIGVLIASAAVVLSVYLPAFWNSTGIIAQPARAIKSQWTPDARDSSSDLYRQAEDANLMATMRTSPIIGYGYGKEIMVVFPMADVKNFDPLVLYLTHDQILWEWMRLGYVGFFAFWIMVVTFIIKSCQLAMDEDASREMKALGIYAALSVVMLMFFGLLDLQLSNVRDILFTATWLGFVSTAIRKIDERRQLQRTPRFSKVDELRIPRRLSTGLEDFELRQGAQNGNGDIRRGYPGPASGTRVLPGPPNVSRR